MVDEKLRIIIEAEDRASGEISKVGKTFGSLGKVVGAAAMAGVGVAAAASGASALVLGKGLSYAVIQAMAAEEANAQLNAVLESTGGIAGVTAQSANELANSLSQVTRFDDETILGAESMLLTFTNIGSGVFPLATQAALDMSTAMGQDLNTSVLQLGKALNDPAEGLAALSRVGVQFTAEQEATITRMVEMGDAAGAQKIILAEMAREFGNSAQAAGGTFGGQIDILKNNLNNIAESVGTAVLPALTELAGKLTAFVQSDEFQAWVEKLAAWLTNELPAAIQSASDFWNTTLKPAIESFVPVLRDDLIPAFMTISNILGTVLPPIIAAFGAGWELQIDIFNLVKDAVKRVVESFQWMWDMIVEVGDALKNLKLPDFLVTNSPTPLELGLVGINRAMSELSGMQLPKLDTGFSQLKAPMGMSYAGAGAGGQAGTGGGTTVVINFNQPVIGFSDRYELMRELGPMIRDYLAGRR